MNNTIKKKKQINQQIRANWTNKKGIIFLQLKENKLNYNLNIGCFYFYSPPPTIINNSFFLLWAKWSERHM